MLTPQSGQTLPINLLIEINFGSECFWTLEK